jgi:hypothetical protein
LNPLSACARPVPVMPRARTAPPTRRRFTEIPPGKGKQLDARWGSPAPGRAADWFALRGPSSSLDSNYFEPCPGVHPASPQGAAPGPPLHSPGRLPRPLPLSRSSPRCLPLPVRMSSNDPSARSAASSASGARRGRREPDLLRPLRPAAPRAGGGRHGRLRRQQACWSTRSSAWSRRSSTRRS